LLAFSLILTTLSYPFMQKMLTIRIFDLNIEVIPAIIIFLCVVLIAGLGGLATDPNSHWYEQLNKPSFQPPASWFGPVWTTIYLLLIISAVITWNTALEEHRKTLMILFILNGIFNLAWSFLFFRGHALVLSGIDILAVLVTIIVLMYNLWPVSHTASLLLLPYLLWVSFASVLNWAIVKLNT